MFINSVFLFYFEYDKFIFEICKIRNLLECLISIGRGRGRRERERGRDIENFGHFVLVLYLHSMSELIIRKIN